MTVHRTLAVAGILLFTSACSIQRQQPPSMSADDHMSHMQAADLRAPRIVTSSGGEVSQGNPGLPASNAQVAARLAASPRHGEWVKIAWEPGSRDSLMAWIVYPMTTRAKSPVVVVVHEIFGLSTWVRGVADQAAAEGFIAIAPDLLSRVRGGPSADTLRYDSATKIIRGVDIAERNKGITAVANYAMSQASAAPKYAVIGYCWGGSTTWGAAVNNGRGFSGGVAFYGAFPYMTAAVAGGAGAAPIADSMAKIKQPVMLLSGSKDPRIGASMPAIDSAMKAMGKWYYGKNYDGAVHGFLRAQDDPKAPSAQCDEACVVKERADNLAAVKDGWPKTVDFLKKNLGI
ncbi:MAG: dienelactone hydrolase [Gemmatimonadetes bacterium]|nr:dienelactone hydrolase [Gemmatimonadota bacterium]